MGKVLDEISEKEADFITKSKVFFVATAPLSVDHHVSLSPKAPGNSCVVLSPHEVAYADLTGSGAETAAHVLQNGRMTLMFCNLERGPPQILRLFGTAEMILAADCDAELVKKFPESITSSFGFRAIYKLKVHRISTSCGYSLPQMDFVKYRQTLEEHVQKEGKDGIHKYQTKKNSFSIDGLPSLALLRKDAPKHVKPVVENGYIVGEDVSNGEISATGEDAMEQARQMHAKHSRNAQVNLSWILVVSVVVAAFGAGVALGPALQILV